MNKYTATRLRTEPIEKLRRLTRMLGVELDRNLDQSEVLEAILDYQLSRIQETASLIRKEGGK